MSPDPSRRVALAAAAAAAIFLAVPAAQGEEGKLVIGASAVNELLREYSDGRKERRCRVVFTLENRTGKALRRARFWVVAANGKRESFGLDDKKTRNRETFDRTPCSDVRRKLKLVRALCLWRDAKKPVNCAGETAVDVK